METDVTRTTAAAEESAAETWAAGESLEIPADLGKWFCPATVLGWVVSEVAGLECNACGHAAEGGCGRRLMASVLAFACARQVFGSEEIGRTCRTEPVLRRLCDRSTPFANELAWFRCRNRPVLEKVLTGVFKRAVRHRFALVKAWLPPELEEDLRTLAVGRLNTARHMDAVENCLIERTVSVEGLWV